MSEVLIAMALFCANVRLNPHTPNSCQREIIECLTDHTGGVDWVKLLGCEKAYTQRVSR